MVTSDLPANTKAPELDDSNAATALRNDAKWTGEDLSAGSAVTEESVGVYLAYLIAIGFMPKPESGKGKALPKISLGEPQRKAMGSIGGRGGTS